MPSASTAKLEKPASSEASDPIKQGITIIEHKIRNMMKKKKKIEENREKEKNGIVLQSDQKLAQLKYDEVCHQLAFAQELKEQLVGILEKGKKKKEKKEAYEREQQEVSKVKEILIIQDVLASMGTDSVREDFLAGRNKAFKLTEAELQYLDDLFVEVSPKREPEEGQPPFLEQAQNAAKHLLSLVEGKDKEIVGTKYSALKELIEKISNSGYFDQTVVEETVVQEPEAPVVEEAPVVDHVEPEPEEVVPEPVPSATFQPSGAPVLEPVVAPVVETAGLYISQRPMADVLTNVMGGGPTAFNFIQESELEPEVVVVPAPAALPIPTQTFTNANFAPPPPGAAAPVYPPHQPPPAEVLYAAPAQYSPAPPPQPQPQPQPPLPPTAVPTTMPVPTQQFENSTNFQTTKSQSGAGDWNDSTEQNDDWAMQVEQSDQNRWNDNNQQNDDWTDNSNDGFQPASRGGGRGGRGRGGGSDRGRGGPRGGRSGYQNGRGNYGNNQSRGGGNYYRNNNEGGNNYYQNGYQSRGDGERGDRGERGERSYRGGGERRGGPRGGQQDRGGNRGAPRGTGGRGGPRGGNNRGTRQ